LGSAHNPQSEIRNPQLQHIGVKWPNDVLLDGGKVCGILIESPGGAAPAKERLIIGIGMNINNSWRNAPRNFGPGGAALCDVTGSHHALQTVLVHSLRSLEERIHQLTGGDSRLPEAWQRLCWLTEQGVEVNANNRWISGVCVGIDDQGALLIKNVNGLHRVCDGSVRIT
jgi:BirA family biotin operon repressor/biotin-[acetyl-CoA-carboxylase] ligase